MASIRGDNNAGPQEFLVEDASEAVVRPRRFTAPSPAVSAPGEPLRGENQDECAPGGSLAWFVQYHYLCSRIHGTVLLLYAAVLLVHQGPEQSCSTPSRAAERARAAVRRSRGRNNEQEQAQSQRQARRRSARQHPARQHPARQHPAICNPIYNSAPQPARPPRRETRPSSPPPWTSSGSCGAASG